MLPLQIEEFSVQSNWWNGNAKIVTYEIDELMATKLRALYQRRKGKDLFDLWHVTKNKMINLGRVFEIFEEYWSKDGLYFTKDEFLKNLESKRNHRGFQSDIHAFLLAESKWNFDEAYQFVVDNVISKLPWNRILFRSPVLSEIPNANLWWENAMAIFSWTWNYPFERAGR